MTKKEELEISLVNMTKAELELALTSLRKDIWIFMDNMPDQEEEGFEQAEKVLNQMKAKYADLSYKESVLIMYGDPTMYE